MLYTVEQTIIGGVRIISTWCSASSIYILFLVLVNYVFNRNIMICQLGPLPIDQELAHVHLLSTKKGPSSIFQDSTLH